jgi:hypothetical protein
MSNSAFDELFGEYEECENQNDCQKNDKRFKFLIGLFLSLIVVSLTAVVSVFYFKNNYPTSSEVLGENIAVHDSENNDFDAELETSLDLFIHKFINASYKVDDSGAFGYIYGDSKKGVFALGDEHTYFKNGRIVSYRYDNDTQIVWDDFYRKYILFDNKMEYYVVTNSSDFYYKHYLGQHILQDFVDDYLKNKEFIISMGEDTWSWEWSFYTPMSELTKHVMQTQVVIDPNMGYLSEIKVLDEGRELCVFEFSFEEIDGIDVKNILEDYERVKEPVTISQP